MPRHMLIGGSRGFPRLELVDEWVAALPGDTVVVSGGAKGVDQRAVEKARARGLAVRVILADWSRGREAGGIRNQQMVDRCDEAVFFWDGKSPGTADCIRRAKAAGKLALVIYPTADVSGMLEGLQDHKNTGNPTEVRGGTQ